MKQGSPKLLLQSRKLQILVVQLPLENGSRFPQGCFQFPPSRVLSTSTQPQLLNSPHQLPCSQPLQVMQSCRSDLNLHKHLRHIPNSKS